MTTNTTLERALISDEAIKPRDRIQEQTDYYARLNEVGRAVVRNQETSLGEFVELLQLSEVTVKMAEAESFSLVFGLLREAPSLWSNCCRLKPTRRKRKRAAIGAVRFSGRAQMPKWRLKES